MFSHNRVAVASLAAACSAFGIGIWLGSPRNISWRQAVISYLLSNSHNPHGYLYVATGLVICTCFLIPVGCSFRSAFPRTRTTLLASVFFVIGVGTLAFEGALSFVTDNLGSFHDTTTAISLFSIVVSMLFYLSQVVFTGRGKSRGIAAVTILSLLTMIAELLYVFLMPNYIGSGSDVAVSHALAAWEWSGITYIAICFSVLIVLSSRYRKES
jgi:hypothetical protein